MVASASLFRDLWAKMVTEQRTETVDPVCVCVICPQTFGFTVTDIIGIKFVCQMTLDHPKILNFSHTRLLSLGLI